MFQNINNISFNESLSLKLYMLNVKNEIYKFAYECESHIFKN